MLRAASVKYVRQVRTVCRGYAILAFVRLFPRVPMALKMAGKPILIAEEWIAYRAALDARALLVPIARAFLACKTFAQHPIVQTAFRMAAKSPLIADRHVRRVVRPEHRARCRKIVRVKNAKVLRAI